MPPRRSQRVQESAEYDNDDVTITNGRSPEVNGELSAGEDGDPSSSYAAKSEGDHVKIMLATDNHIGYLEKDPIRGQDSINTFREILQLAQEHEVDFILLGGDLFHENKPSRTTLHQVMGLLREYTLGDKPVSIELLSDPNDGRAEGYSFPAVNYEDSNLNVAIPCFSIHGNHDDPQGVGAEGALSALDLLSVSGLVNYFGKIELPTTDELASRAAERAPAAGGLSDVGIRIRPVLLQKGRTKIALYGMGNIKDERMHFELRKNRVRMYRPREDPEEWFNILTLHQNRAAHDPKAVVPESMFDDSIHYVVWGHEHEQRIMPEPVSGKRYYISQPGSSVATSLCPGEAAEKQVAIIHVEGRDFMVEPIPLKTVRPFVMDDIDLDDAIEEAGLQLDEKQAVIKLLKRKITDLIAKANSQWQEANADVPVSKRPEKMLPLVRLRVAYTRHDIGNIVRFGQDFVDKVANPRDLLQFHKKKAARASTKNANLKEHYQEPTEEMLPQERLEKVRVSELVATYLSTQSLQILNPAGLERAVTNFVEKDDRDAIGHFVDKEMKTTNSGLVAINPDEAKLSAELNRIRDEKMQLEDSDGSDAGMQTQRRGSAAPTRSAATTTQRRGRHDSDDSMLEDMDNDDFDAPAPPPTASRRRNASPVKGSVKAPSTTQRSNSGPKHSQQTLTFRGNSEDDDGEFSDGPLSSMASTSKATSSRAAALSAASSSKKTPAKKTAAPKKPAASAASRSTAKRAATSRTGRKSYADESEDDFAEESVVISDSEDDGFEGGSKTKKKPAPVSRRAR